MHLLSKKLLQVILKKQLIEAALKLKKSHVAHNISTLDIIEIASMRRIQICYSFPRPIKSTFKAVTRSADISPLLELVRP